MQSSTFEVRKQCGPRDNRRRGADASERDRTRGRWNARSPCSSSEIPYYYVGRHLPARRRRAGARPVPRQAVAAHAHPARPRHLRRRRDREADHHRRRRERRSAVPGVQPRDASRRSSCRSCSGARRARRDRHRQRSAGGVRRRPIARCSKPSRPCSRRRSSDRTW